MASFMYVTAPLYPRANPGDPVLTFTFTCYASTLSFFVIALSFPHVFLRSRISSLFEAVLTPSPLPSSASSFGYYFWEHLFLFILSSMPSLFCFSVVDWCPFIIFRMDGFLELHFFISSFLAILYDPHQVRFPSTPNAVDNRSPFAAYFEPHLDDHH